MKKKQDSRSIWGIASVVASVVLPVGAMPQDEREPRQHEGKRQPTVPCDDCITCGGVTVVPIARSEEAVSVGGPFAIAATFGAGVTPARQAVIQQAINEWQTTIETAGTTPNNYEISFSY